MTATCIRLGAACALALFTVKAGAAGTASRPGDYAHIIPLTVSGKQAVVQFQLPRTVYLYARTPGLRDLRIFDATGTSLPYAFVDQARQTLETRSIVPVPVFPVRAPDGSTLRVPDGSTLRVPDGLQIRTANDGAVISVTTPTRPAVTETLVSLIVDLQAAAARRGGTGPAPAAALVLSLPPKVSTYSGRLTLEASEDLQTWSTLAESAVSWLANNHGATVRKDRIEFAQRPLRYARIRWIEGAPVEFSVRAELVTREQSPEQWNSIVLAPKPPADTNELLYDAPIALPVESLGLALKGENVVLRASVGPVRQRTGHSRAESAGLAGAADATFFQLTQNGKRRVSADLTLPPTHAAQWFVRPFSKIDERPGLRLRWKPVNAVFVASGNAPYSVAYGRSGDQTSRVDVSQVAPGFSAAELAALEHATLGEAIRQHGASAGVPGSLGDAEGEADRSTWLWAVLGAGIAALTSMAWKLSRELKEKQPGIPDV